MNKNYPITLRELTADEGGGWLAMVQDLPGCVGDGETPAEATADVMDAIDEWIDAAKQMGRPIPEPRDPMSGSFSGKWVQRVPKSLHAQLAAQADSEGVSINQLATTYIAQGLGVWAYETKKSAGRRTSKRSVAGERRGATAAA